MHHRRAVAWFARIRDEGWATSPVTESGFVRVSSNQRAIPDARTPSEAIDLLRRLRQVGRHHSWPDDVSPTDASAHPFERVHGYRQVTDAHLLSLVLRHGGLLATFDGALVDLAPEGAEAVERIE